MTSQGNAPKYVESSFKSTDRTRTVDMLPQIFQTKTNKKFLNATLDQLTQKSSLQKIQGFVGRRTGIGVTLTEQDNYLQELDNTRSNYQLEPSCIYKDADNTSKVRSAITYPGLIDSLKIQDANVTRHDRLFKEQYYTWDPFIDYDKFVNFSQYYWLPAGPNEVDVSQSDLLLSNDYEVSEVTLTDGNTAMNITEVDGNNPVLTLVRGGNYTFDAQNITGGLYIQDTPTTDGQKAYNTNYSAREVLGVTDNGVQSGKVSFNVPDKTAQNEYITMPVHGKVDLATTQTFDALNYKLVADIVSEGGIDGITDLDGKTVIFLTKNPDSEVVTKGWLYQDRFDQATEPFDDDSLGFARQVGVTLQGQRYGVWQIRYNTDGVDVPFIELIPYETVAQGNKIEIEYGDTHAGLFYWKTPVGYYDRVPNITANKDTLYYIVGGSETSFGEIRLVPDDSQGTLQISDIIGKKTYTSPNGVIFTNGLKVKFRGATEPSTYIDQVYYVEGVGDAIELLPIGNFKTPEEYTESSTEPFDATDVGFDATGYGESLDAPVNQDYFTIGRQSKDRNAWTRSNRWFHYDVLVASATYNKADIVVDQNARAQRPIMEYRSGMRLYNYGTEGVDPVDLYDTSVTDVLSNVNGQTEFKVDNVELADGQRIIFSADTDPEVRNKIYKVSLIDHTSVDSQQAKIINLTETGDSISTDQTIFVLSGFKRAGKQYHYTADKVWKESQQKTLVNQEPLFALYDPDDKSLTDATAYPSSTFTGSKLFSYAPGTGQADSILGKKLKYRSLNNVGDIVYDNNIEKDTFSFVPATGSKTINTGIGSVRRYSDRTTYTRQVGWQTAISDQSQFQEFEFTYTKGTPPVLDVPKNTGNFTIEVYKNNEYMLPSNYSTTVTATQTTINFVTEPATGDILTVCIQSDQASSAAFYQLPENLQNNGLNQKFDDITLGTIRNHYLNLTNHHPDKIGPGLGANNMRDLGNIVPYGRRIVQHSAPLPLSMTFSRSGVNNFYDALEFARTEYENFKIKIIDALIKNDFTGTVAEKLDKIIAYVNAGKTASSPYYYTDTIPHGEIFTATTYTVTAFDDKIFDLSKKYDYTKANFEAVSIYLNDEILSVDKDYTISATGPQFTIDDDITLSTGDVIKVREYADTKASYCPPTPTKLGLYPRYLPEKITDTTYTVSQSVIVGHDGSRTVAYGDFRDDILLEFEKRMYNNIKLTDQPPMDVNTIIPGKFRTTDYTQAEIVNTWQNDFLTWVSQNIISYKTQAYDETNKFTWNYNTAWDKDQQLLPGHWRAIYQLYYDTDRPHTHPWEMLGFTIKPTWWENEYGLAPYTSGNENLWDDIEAGYVRAPTPYTLSRYKRPELKAKYLPVDDEGALKNPVETVIKQYVLQNMKKQWAVGDRGPAEDSWRKSSSWAFTVQKLLALTKPAQYFALNIDRDNYKYDTTLQQWLYKGRRRIQPTDIDVPSNTLAKHSYLNWIVENNRRRGMTDNTAVTNDLNNINLQLAYRMGGYTDKAYLKVFTEKTSPQSNSESLLLPDESFQILLYENEIFDTVQYSSVIVQKTDTGWQVFGNSKTKPYFNIVTSLVDGSYSTFSVGKYEVNVAQNFVDRDVKIPYGYEFNNISSLSDFIASYGRWLESQGFKFADLENNYILDWSQMIREVMYWDQQGWTTGAIININPAATRLYLERQYAVPAPIVGRSPDDFVLNQNLNPIENSALVFDRTDNQFSVETTDENAISYLNTKFTAYEHLLVFDNKSVFADVIYDPQTGERQNRLKLVGSRTGDWNGQVNAPGFIFNIDNVQEWSNTQEYSKGDIVLFKSQYYTSLKTQTATAKFNYTDWAETEYADIKTGLLPNLNLRSEQVENYYDPSVANLERDADILTYGILGFREREYMTNMGLDDVSQISLFKNFLPEIGTKRTLDLFKSVTLDKEKTEYDVFENWGIKRGIYGATASRKYAEFQLLESRLTGNPASLELIENGGTSESNQSVEIGNIYKQDFGARPITSPELLPSGFNITNDLSLPTAGYVNSEDVDITTYDLKTLNKLNEALPDVQEGKYIWVAHNNDFDWTVYRATTINAELDTVNDNLTGTSTLNFNRAHGLSVNDIIALRYTTIGDSANQPTGAVDAVYQVLSVPGISKAEVNLSLEQEITEIQLQGVAFKFSTARVADSAKIADLPYLNKIKLGNKVWVDNNGEDKWQVLEKINPFDPSASITRELPTSDIQYGNAIAQTLDGKFTLVGAPLAGSNSNGQVLTYARTTGGLQDQLQKITPSATAANIRKFGDAIAVGGNQWTIIGAPESQLGEGFAFAYNKPDGSQQFIESQIIVSPTDAQDIANFGSAMAISENEQWALIGSKGTERVHLYQRIDVQAQRAVFTGDGSTKQFDIKGSILADTTAQIICVIDNNVIAEADYTLGGTVITFDNAPRDLADIKVTRRIAKSYQGDGETKTFDISSLYAKDSINSITVIKDGVIQRPKIDWDYADDSSLVFNFATAPSSGAEILVNANTYWDYVSTVVNPGDTFNEFGASVSISQDGTQFAIGAPKQTVSGLTEAGTVYVYDREIQKFQVQDDSADSYVTRFAPAGQPKLYLNGDEILDSTKYVGGTWTRADRTYTLASTPVAGQELQIDVNRVRLLQTMTATTVRKDAEYGHKVKYCNTNCSLYISAPGDDLGESKTDAGSVERYVNVARYYDTITGTVANPVVVLGSEIRINGYYVKFDSGTDIDAIVNDINKVGIPNVIASKNSANQLVIGLTNKASVGAELQVLPAGEYDSGPLSILGLTLFDRTQTITSPNPLSHSRFGDDIAVSPDSKTVVVSSPTGSTVTVLTLDNSLTSFDGSTTVIQDIKTQSGLIETFDYLSTASDTRATPGTLSYGVMIQDKEVEETSLFGKAISYRNQYLVATAPDYLTEDSVITGRLAVFENTDNKFSWNPIRTQSKVVDVHKINSVFIYDRNTGQKKTYLDWIDPLQGKVLGVCEENLNFIRPVDPARYNNGDSQQNSYWASEHTGELWWDVSTVRYLNHYQGDEEYRQKSWSLIFDGASVDVYEWIESDQLPQDYTGEGTVRDVTQFTATAAVAPSGLVQTKYYYWVRGITTVPVNSNKELSAATIAQYLTDPKGSGVAYMAPIAPGKFSLYNAKTYISANDSILHIDYDEIDNDANVHSQFDLLRINDPSDFLSDVVYLKFKDSLAGTDSVGNAVPNPLLSVADRYGIESRPRQGMFRNRFLALKNYIVAANRELIKLPVLEFNGITALYSEEPQPTSVSGKWDKKVLTHAELTYINVSTLTAGYKVLVHVDETVDNLWTIYELLDNGTWSLDLVQGYKTEKYWTAKDWYATGYDSAQVPVKEIDVYGNLPTIRSDVAVGDIVKVLANADSKFEWYVKTTTSWDRVALEDGTLEINSSLYDYVTARVGLDQEAFDNQRFDIAPNEETRQIIEAINKQIFIDEHADKRATLLNLVLEYVISETKSVEWLVKTSLLDVKHNIRDLKEYPVLQDDNQTFLQDYIQEVKPYHSQVKEYSLLYNGIDTWDGAQTDFDLPAKFDPTIDRFVSPRHIPGSAFNSTGPFYVQATGKGRSNGLFGYFYPLFTSKADANTFDKNNGGAGASHTHEFDEILGTFHMPLSDQNHATATFDRDYSQWTTVLSDGQYLLSDPIWGDTEYKNWASSFYLNLDSVTVTAKGSGYSVPPQVTVTGESETDATFKARINTAGEVIAIDIITEGSKYTTTPILTLSGGNGTGAQATVVTSHDQIRALKTVQKFDRYEYASAVTEWKASTVYNENDLVRYNQKVYKSLTGDGSTVGPATFDPDDWTVVDAAELSGVNRTMGLYSPTTDQTGLDLNLLISGTEFPGVQVVGPTFAEGTGFGNSRFDTVVYDNILFDTDTGAPTYSTQILDTEYRPGSFVDTFLGTKAEDINVDGGDFIDSYHSFAPEELIPGSTFDTLSMKVFTRRGKDFEGDGHGFEQASQIMTYESASNTTFHFGDLITQPFSVRAYNVTTGLALRFEYKENTESTIDYSVNWKEQTITFFENGRISNNDFIGIHVTSIGGGNQLYVRNYTLTDFVGDGSSAGYYIDLPVEYAQVYEMRVLINGSVITDFTVAKQGNDTRLSIGFSDGSTMDDITHGHGIDADDYISVAVMGYDNLDDSSGSTDQVLQDYTGHNGDLVVSSSYPVSEFIFGDGSSSERFTLNNEYKGTNPYTAIVEHNGVRLTPPETIVYTSDGSQEHYIIDINNHPLIEHFTDQIKESEVHVFVDGEKLNLNEDYQVAPIPGGKYDFDDSSTMDDTGKKFLMFTEGNVPVPNAQIKIFVETFADYRIQKDSLGQFITFKHQGITGSTEAFPDGDRVQVTSFWNTTEQDIRCQIFKDSESQELTLNAIKFDEKGYDADPFDDSGPIQIIQSFNWDLGFTPVNPDELHVTKNGLRQYRNTHWTMDGQKIVFIEDPANTDVVVVQSFTPNKVPDELNFNIFEDMQDNKVIYRMTDNNMTELAQDLAITDDTIHVMDIAKLTKPVLADGVFGVVTINGERITYRNRNDNGTLTGLRRGTAGTGATSHSKGDIVNNTTSGENLDNSLYAKVWYDLDTATGNVRQQETLSRSETTAVKFLKGLQD